MPDNTKTFRAASKEIPEEVRRYMVDMRISWTFNVEKAQWWGGLRMLYSLIYLLLKPFYKPIFINLI